jgi:indole-3-glycerol phosphate synthase
MCTASSDNLPERVFGVGELEPSTEVRHTPEGALHPIFTEKLSEVAAIMLLPEARQDGPLSMRLGYMAPETNYAFSDAIRRCSAIGRLGVVADMKRFATDSAGGRIELQPPGSDLIGRAKQLLSAGADALMVACDAPRFGGGIGDLERLTEVLRGGGRQASGRVATEGAPVVAKDFVVHPIQIAQMVEAGATSVLLICSLVGPDLELFLNACTIMGVEALVEVNTSDEVLFAIESGATAIVVNRRSRATGALDRKLAVQMGALIPGHILSLAAGAYGACSDGQPINGDEFEAVHEAGYDGIVIGRALCSPAGLSSGEAQAQVVIAEIKRHELLQQAAAWGR